MAHMRWCLVQLLMLSAFLAPAAATTHFSDEPNSCQIIGNPDIYGIGIRLGFYLQTAAVLLAIWFAPRQTSIARAASNVISIAVLANTFRDSTRGSLVAIEWYIVIWMVVILPLSNVPMTKALLRVSAPSYGIMLTIICMVIYSQVWLAYHGFEIGHKPGCDAKIFLFRGISVYHSTWRKYLKGLSIIGCFIGLCVFARAVYCLGKSAFGKWNGADYPEKDEDYGLHIKLYYTLGNSINLVLTTVQIEKTIKINKINLSAAPLTSSGQLIPFVIGICTVAATLGAAFKAKVRPSLLPQ